MIIANSIKEDKANKLLCEAEIEKNKKMLSIIIEKQGPKIVRGVDYESKMNCSGGGHNENDLTLAIKISNIKSAIIYLEKAFELYSTCYNKKLKAVKEILTKEEYEIFNMKYIECLTRYEIADKLNYSVDNVKRKIKIIRSKLSVLEDVATTKYVN